MWKYRSTNGDVDDETKKINGINRPAIAVLWPSTNSRGFNILLDAGADIRADAQDLCQYALMGVSYAKVVSI